MTFKRLQFSLKTLLEFGEIKSVEDIMYDTNFSLEDLISDEEDLFTDSGDGLEKEEETKEVVENSGIKEEITEIKTPEPNSNLSNKENHENVYDKTTNEELEDLLG
jgi:hypothetical protein